MTDQPISVRDVLLLLLAAERYPRYSNHDWRVADIMEADALTKAATAVASPKDPPEFAVWLATLRRKNLTSDEREVVYLVLGNHFDHELMPSGTT